MLSYQEKKRRIKEIKKRKECRALVWCRNVILFFFWCSIVVFLVSAIDFLVAVYKGNGFLNLPYEVESIAVFFCVIFGIVSGILTKILNDRVNNLLAIESMESEELLLEEKETLSLEKGVETVRSWYILQIISCVLFGLAVIACILPCISVIGLTYTSIPEMVIKFYKGFFNEKTEGLGEVFGEFLGVGNYSDIEKLISWKFVAFILFVDGVVAGVCSMLKTSVMNTVYILGLRERIEKGLNGDFSYDERRERAAEWLFEPSYLVKRVIYRVLQIVLPLIFPLWFFTYLNDTGLIEVEFIFYLLPIVFVIASLVFEVLEKIYRAKNKETLHEVYPLLKGRHR